jgi:hypothetical protein
VLAIPRTYALFFKKKKKERKLSSKRERDFVAQGAEETYRGEWGKGGGGGVTFATQGYRKWRGQKGVERIEE